MSRILAVLALVVAFFSLGLNVLMIARLEQGRQAALQTLDATSQQLDSIADLTITQTVRINRAYGVSGQFPLNENMSFPISMTVPFSSAINVNVNTPFGPMNMPINVNTSVPVRMQVPVVISRTIPYSLTVPLNFEIPVQIRLRDMGLEPTIRQTQGELQRLRGALK